MSGSTASSSLRTPLLSSSHASVSESLPGSPQRANAMDKTYVDPPRIDTEFPTTGSSTPNSSSKSNDSHAATGLAMSDLVINDGEDDVTLINQDGVGKLSRDRISDRPTELIPRLRWRVHRFVDNLYVRLFGLVLVVADLTVLMIRLSENDWKLRKHSEKEGYTIFSIVIISYFLLELAVRIFALSPRYFFTKPLEVIDFVVIVLSAIFEFALDVSRVVTFGRLVRFVILIRLVTEHYNLRKAARLTIAENKRRYRKDGFDLDLTYVTDRIIAMSFPSRGVRALYRNPIREVVRFFKTKHPNHFKIYNCCSERDYDHRRFDNRVENCPIDDHNVPLMTLMLRFCEDASQFLRKDPDNVVAIHCKGGKGRTGTMICALMLYCDKFDTAKDSLDYFAMRRTDLDVSRKFQGVQTPSQGRYVGYMEDVIKRYNRQLPPRVSRTISTIRVVSLLVDPSNASGARSLSFEVFCDNLLVYDFDAHQAVGSATAQSLRGLDNPVPIVEFDVENLRVEGDVKVKFKGSGLPKRYDACPFYFWFNPSFHTDASRIVFPREVLDNAHKPKTWKYYDENFAVEVYFTDEVQTDHALSPTATFTSPGAESLSADTVA